MAELRTILRNSLNSPAVINWRGWRGLLLLGVFALVLAAIPHARALLIAGLAGGVILGVVLILIRQQSGPPRPRRGTPIVLFPRPVSQVSDLLSRSNLSYLRG